VNGVADHVAGHFSPFGLLGISRLS
jgi:hypothetical protein